LLSLPEALYILPRVLHLKWKEHSSQGKQVKRFDMTCLFTASGASKIISYPDGRGRYDVSLAQ
jgi:hypothetical protein